MKITIEYDEEQDAKLALEAWDWKHSLLEIDQLLRSTTKHNIYQNKEASEDEYRYGALPPRTTKRNFKR